MMRESLAIMQSIFSSPSRPPNFRPLVQLLLPRRWAKNALHYVARHIRCGKTRRTEF
jgi:hypothetical protein